MKSKILSFFLLLIMNFVFAQTSQFQPAIAIGNDTFAIVNLSTVTIVSKREFRNEREAKRWNRLRHDVIKVYPYAKSAGKILKDIDSDLALLKNEKEKKKYLDKKEEELKENFEKNIRELTITQGKILIKLIDRETRHTCFHLVKEFRGGFSAFLWQTVARIFNSSLKYEYDSLEDKEIEAIITSLEEQDLAAAKK